MSIVIVNKKIYYRVQNKYFKKEEGKNPERIGKKEYEMARINSRRFGRGTDMTTAIEEAACDQAIRWPQEDS